MKKKNKKTDSISDLIDQLVVIPRDSFLVFNTSYPDELIEILSDHSSEMKSRGITGIILDSTTKLESLTDEDLKGFGLYKIPGTGTLH